MRPFILLLCVASLAPAILSVPANAATLAEQPPAIFEALRRADLRLAIIGERLAVSNAALCRDRKPWLGMVIHTAEQYQPAVRADARAAFGFTSAVGVEAVAPEGPAARAGVKADDALLAIAGQPLPQKLPDDGARATTATRDATERLIARLPESAPVALTVRRAQAERELRLTPQAGCRARFEIHFANEAAADDEIVQIGARFVDALDDTWLPAVVAHELAHIILRHRARMIAAGVRYGLLAEFGKSGRLHAQAEQEADRLSVYLLANAGYDPLLPARFWRGPGKDFDGGLFRSRIYPDRRARAAMLEEEAARLAGAALPVTPALLALADQPMR